jgi:hypothetical protein
MTREDILDFLRAILEFVVIAGFLFVTLAYAPEIAALMGAF